jgi:hypothetical protein
MHYGPDEHSEEIDPLSYLKVIGPVVRLRLGYMDKRGIFKDVCE